MGDAKMSAKIVISFNTVLHRMSIGVSNKRSGASTVTQVTTSK